MILLPTHWNESLRAPIAACRVSREEELRVVEGGSEGDSKDEEEAYVMGVVMDVGDTYTEWQILLKNRQMDFGAALVANPAEEDMGNHLLLASVSKADALDGEDMEAEDDVTMLPDCTAPVAIVNAAVAVAKGVYPSAASFELAATLLESVSLYRAVETFVV